MTADFKAQASMEQRKRLTEDLARIQAEQHRTQKMLPKSKRDRDQAAVNRQATLTDLRDNVATLMDIRGKVEVAVKHLKDDLASAVEKKEAEERQQEEAQRVGFPSPFPHPFLTRISSLLATQQ